MNTRHLRLAVAILIPAALAQAASGPRYGGELRLAMLRTADDDVPLSRECLVGLDADGRLRPRLARAFTPGASDREWILELEPGLTFHDGSPLEATHVVASLRRFLKSSRASATVLAGAVGEIDAPDREHVRLRFLRPASELSLLPLASVRAAVVSDSGSGCGPFVPTVSSGDDRVFVAFGGHVRGRPYLDRVRLRTVADARRLHSEWRLGRVEVALDEEGEPAGSQLLLLALDDRRPAFESAHARLAVLAAIDRERLARHTLHAAEPWSLLLPSEPAGGGDATTIARTGVTDAPARMPSRITMAVDRAVPPLASQRVVAHLAGLGIAADVVPAEREKLRQLAVDARLFLYSPELPEAALSVFEIASAYPVFEADALDAAREADPSRRLDRALAVERRLRETGLVTALARVTRTMAVARSVHGLLPSSLEDAWLDP